MGTKQNPGAFDCYADAEPDEPMFVLLARDVFAATLVALWSALRIGDLKAANLGLRELQKIVESRGPSTEEDLQKAFEAAQCAQAMVDWIEANRPGKLRRGR